MIRILSTNLNSGFKDVVRQHSCFPEFSDRLEYVINASRLSQREIGRITGRGRKVVMSYKKQEGMPSAYFVFVICNIFGISADWLLFGKGERPSEDEIYRVAKKYATSKRGRAD